MNQFVFVKNKIKEIVWKFFHWFNVNSNAYNVGHTIRETYWFLLRATAAIKAFYKHDKNLFEIKSAIKNAGRPVRVWYLHDKNVYKVRALAAALKKRLAIVYYHDKNIYKIKKAVQSIKQWFSIFLKYDKRVYTLKQFPKRIANRIAIWWRHDKYVERAKYFLRGNWVFLHKLRAWWLYDEALDKKKRKVKNFFLWFDPDSKVTNIRHTYDFIVAKTNYAIYKIDFWQVRTREWFFETIIYKKIQSSTWCPYPWFNLNSNTDGNIKLCCSITENHHVGEGALNFNFGKDPIEKIWNSKYMKDIREDLSNNRKPKACDVCWKMEDKNIQSSRLAALRDKPHWSGQPVATLPTSLELRLGNKCNLKCLSCWSLSSSSILAEREKALERTDLDPWVVSTWAQEVKEVKEVDQEWFRSPTFKESFKKMAPTLKRLYLTGGEPTLIDENCEFLQMLLDANNYDCAVSFTTNATIWNEKFYGLISKFKSSEVQISLDGFGQMNEYVRYPSNWSHIDRNLRKIFALPKKVNIKVFSVVSILNVMRVSEVVEFLLDNLSHRSYIYAPIILQSPDFLSTQILSKEYRQAAADRITEFLKSRPQENKEIWYKYGMQYIIDQLKFGMQDEAKRGEYLGQAKNYILAHEKIRKMPHPNKAQLFEEGLL